MFKKVYIEITNICNLKCKFCPETSRNKQYMNVADFEKIIQKIHKQTNLVCLHVKGEPLLHTQLGKFLNIFINQDKEFTWPNINGEKTIERGRCLALKDQIAILVDGTVVPCCLDNNGDIPLGNILEEDLEYILNKEKTREIKNNFENNIITCELCRTCGFLEKLEEKRKYK